MHEGTRSTRRWRLATLLALGVVIGVLVSATPAGAHFQASINHIWSHIKPKAEYEDDHRLGHGECRYLRDRNRHVS